MPKLKTKKITYCAFDQEIKYEDYSVEEYFSNMNVNIIRSEYEYHHSVSTIPILNYSQCLAASWGRE